MCGISGFIDNKNIVTKIHLANATNALKHRGGNGSGILIEKIQNFTIGLANERLATIDLSDDGLQPFTSPCGQYTITFNGTIYNHVELRNELTKAGIVFKTQSDTEVLLACYQKYRENLFSKIDGAFAFAIIDRKENQLFVARDAVGVKPLYIYKHDDFFAFSSEIKGLLAFPIKKEINKNALTSFLRNGYFKGEECIYKNIYRFKKQHYQIINLNSGQLLEKEFEYAFEKQILTSITERDLLSDIENLLTDSVLKRSTTNANFGVLLSGGYDSATVAAILQQKQEKKIKTYTLGFENKNFDEAPFAKNIASHLNTEHQEFYIGDTGAIEILENLPEIFDEPMGDSGAIPLSYITKQIAKDNTKVVLGAEGGDELFAGYESYKKALKVEKYRKLVPRPLQNLISSTFESRALKINEIFNSNSLIETYQATVAYFSHHELKEILNSDIIVDTYKLNADQDIKDLLAYDIENYLPNDLLLKSDACCMHFGIDNRDSLLKTDLLVYLKNVDKKWMIKNGELKYLLKRITHQYIPKKLMDRPKKGFSIPIADWMEHIFKPYIDQYLSPTQLNKHQLFNVKAILKIKDDFYLNGAKSNAKKLWLLLQFQMWFNKWID
jgi:asparagine synthase (glutamine-hydrolysing)